MTAERWQLLAFSEYRSRVLLNTLPCPGQPQTPAAPRPRNPGLAHSEHPINISYETIHTIIAINKNARVSFFPG